MTAVERPSDDLLLGLVENADDAVIVADASGAIRYWNAASETTFGFTSDEAMGASLDIIIPVKLRDRHWEGYRRVMASGHAEYAARMLAGAGRPGGRNPHLGRVHGHAAARFEGTLWGIGAIMRDVTARWYEQRELRRELDTLKRDVASPAG